MRIKVGDKVKINTLETTVQELVIKHGTEFVRTDYGDFNIEIVEKI